MSDPLKRLFEAGREDDWLAYRRYQYLLAKLLFFLTLGYLLYVILAQASGVLSMLFVSLLAAYVLDPVVDWFEARGLSRTVAIVGLVLITVATAALFIVWMVPTLVSEFGQVGVRVHGALARDPAEIMAWLESTLGISIAPETIEEARAKAQEYAPAALEYVGEIIKNAATRTMGVVGWLLNAVMIPVFVFYFLRDFDKMKAWVVDHLPLRHRPFIVKRAQRVDAVIGDWLRGQVQVAIMLAVLYATGLAIVGIELAIPIGVLAGLLNVVPYLGFAFGFGLAMLMVLLEWSGIGSVLGVIAVFGVAQTLEGYVLTPKIVGEKVGLSPVTVIIVLLLGGELFGLLGFLLAVPLAGALKTVFGEIMDWYRESEAFLGEDDPPDDPPAATDPPPGDTPDSSGPQGAPA